MARKELQQLLDNSQAIEEFKQAVLDFKEGKNTDLIVDQNGNPPVKILRLISYVLDQQSELPIESISVKAASGCSDFTGTADINQGQVQVDFKWDCAWRAKEEGWKDYFGFPDQIKAAKEFDYDCFETFEIKTTV